MAANYLSGMDLKPAEDQAKVDRTTSVCFVPRRLQSVDKKQQRAIIDNMLE